MRHNQVSGLRDWNGGFREQELGPSDLEDPKTPLTGNASSDKCGEQSSYTEHHCPSLSVVHSERFHSDMG